MKTPFEKIQPDEGSSFRLLHHRVTSDTFLWNYHYHPEFELVYVLDGTGRRHVGNHLSYYQDGDLVLIGSNLPHSGFGFGALGIHEEIVVQFKDDLLGENFLTKPEMKLLKALFERSQHGLCFSGETKNRIGQKLKKLLSLQPFARLMLLMDIFGELADSDEYILLNDSKHTYDFNLKDQTRLKKIYEYVKHNYQKPIDIQEIASISNLTVPAFCNYFKKVINLTFTDFVNEYRINQACRMLLTDQSITDICYECGFANQSYFSKVFKQIKGKTPMEFRKEVANRK
ncbi:MAG: AraC family transcriptional regulator [Spirosomataceae bacterium]